MNDVSFGQWLSRYRKSIGLTQKQLAECLNCATITLRKIEAEQRRPSSQLIERMVQVLEIPTSEHSAFSYFARGYSPTIHPIGKMNFPWRFTRQKPDNKLLDGLAPQGWQDQDVQVMLRDLLDTQLHPLPWIQPNSSGEPIYYQVTRSQSSQSQDEPYLLVLVPMKILNSLFQIAFQSRKAPVESINSEQEQLIGPTGSNELPGIFAQFLAPLDPRLNSLDQ